MIKKIVLCSILLLSTFSYAQEGTASPYSFYGIGELKFRGTVENKAMGGLNILPDSIHINLKNPATLPALKLTTFAIAGSSNASNLKNAFLSENTRRSSFDYFVMTFPVKKFGLTLGIMPNSFVGYKIQKIIDNGIDNSARYTGSGGTNKAFVGGGYEITPKLSIGINVDLNFGKIERYSAVFRPVEDNVQFGSREMNTSIINGLSFHTGLIYKTKYKKYDLVTSLTITPTSNLSSKNEKEYATISLSSDGSERVWETLTPLTSTTKIKLPTSVSFGAGVGELKKWFLGFEANINGKTNYGSTFASNVSFNAAKKFSLGGYYTPNYNSFSNYFNKITYRAGVRHENTGLIINTKSINDSALTFGLGLPLGGSFSNMNLGIEYGKKGTKSSNLIQENYFNVSIGLSLNDRWFIKRKFD